MPCPSPGDLPTPGTEPRTSAVARGFFTTESPGKTIQLHHISKPFFPSLTLQNLVPGPCFSQAEGSRSGDGGVIGSGVPLILLWPLTLRLRRGWGRSGESEPLAGKSIHPPLPHQRQLTITVKMNHQPQSSPQCHPLFTAAIPGMGWLWGQAGIIPKAQLLGAFIYS